jgi:hypothetical protein
MIFMVARDSLIALSTGATREEADLGIGRGQGGPPYRPEQENN